MQILEERVVLAGEQFTRSEIQEIANVCILATDGVSYTLKTDATLTSVVRRSKAIQRAMQAGLFIVTGIDMPIQAGPELRSAIERYR